MQVLIASFITGNVTNDATCKHNEKKTIFTVPKSPISQRRGDESGKKSPVSVSKHKNCADVAVDSEQATADPSSVRVEM